MNLLELPDCMLLDIFEFLTYEEVSKNRLVCRRINQICQQVLNGGFSRAVRQHTTIFKRIKSMLPRRESERRNHSLARHADILTSIETRISMLSMTYCKYIDLNLCCFIPGRVLDEIFRILSLVSKTRKTLRPHEVLQELRDISSMAIEHFDEKIANLLKSYVDSVGNRSNAGGIENKRITPASSGLGNIIFSVQTGSSSMWPQSNSTSKMWTPPTRAAPMKMTCNTCNDSACEAILNRMAALINMKSPHSDSSDSTDWDSLYTAIGCCGSKTAGTSPRNEGQQNRSGCPEARATMAKYKKLELEYKNGIQRMNRMQHIQVQQSRRLQQTMNTIATMSTQITELKKRLEDLDAKNREISANIKQINPATGESTNAAPVVGAVPSTEVNDDGVDVSIDPSEGPSAAKKRRCDGNSTGGKRKPDAGEKPE
ncbi:uncharacterized protein LOC118748094 [Rhagoletis pomonella]|uniref:uncharacterized protein LOC118748094 n=1 Tax=Rhagoletis pomonella TaxID=28610 RepID=UPI0017819305|nr:uncharacterized protein LOC118748094 [Rhagoletis pomonella]